MSSRSGERDRGGQAVPRVSRSRGDKSRTVTVAPLPQVTVDVIPGRFTEEDWLSMVVAEDGEDVVGDIVESLMNRVMEECLIVHLQQQVMPYTMSQVRDALLQVVHWTFVPRDEGDDDTGGNQQEELQPYPHDSWAQGCVPVTSPTDSPRSTEPQACPQHPITDVPEQVEDPPGAEEPPTSSQELICPPGAEIRLPAPQTRQPMRIPTPPTVPSRNRPHYRPHRGPLRSAGLKNITTSLEETEKQILLEQLVRTGSVTEDIDLLPTSLYNILKIQLGRPPQKKDVVYDSSGNVLSMPKVDLSRLPQHHVRPRAEVLDASMESGRSRRARGGQGAAKTCPTRRSQGGSSSSDPPQLLLHGVTTRAEDLPGWAPVPTTGLLLNTMPLTDGVILRERDRAERGVTYNRQQREHAKEGERRELRPVPASITLPSLTVEQLLKNNVPQVQPLASFLSNRTSGATTSLYHRV